VCALRAIAEPLNQNVSGNCLNKIFARAGDKGCVEDAAPDAASEMPVRAASRKADLLRSDRKGGLAPLGSTLPRYTRSMLAGGQLPRRRLHGHVPAGRAAKRSFPR